MASPTFDREISNRAAARSSMGALACVPAGFEIGPCPYCAHRGDDWQLASGGPMVCGVCHPPAPGLDIRRSTT